MWYMPYVRVRRAVSIYGIFVIAISLIAIAIRFWPGAVHYSSHNQTNLATVNITIDMLLSGAAAVVAGLATVLGLNLAAENEGHLELAWTKPISRQGYALGVFAVDIGAMVVCLLLTAVCGAIVADVYIGHQAVEAGPVRDIIRALVYCGLPLCVYAWITALSASMKRNRGAAAGLFWPVMAILAVLTVVPVPLVHTIATAIDTINPLSIYSNNSPRGIAQPSTATYLWGWAVSAALLAAAVAQWRRLEV